jgi:ADP-ribose pyrophosphatase YjhB (NUDIX family)
MLDEKEMFRRKNDFMGYTFCPRCGIKLIRKEIDHKIRLTCPHSDCDYIYYHNPIPAAGAIVINDDRILMVKRAVMPKIGWWCIPAGFMEWSEHPGQTAIRELKEETGLEIELLSLFEIYSGQDDPRLNAVLILYLARSVGGRLTAADDAMEVRYFGFDELPEKIAFISHRQALKDYKDRYM